jgi:hypothetical protein
MITHYRRADQGLLCVDIVHFRKSLWASSFDDRRWWVLGALAVILLAAGPLTVSAGRAIRRASREPARRTAGRSPAGLEAPSFVAAVLAVAKTSMMRWVAGDGRGDLPRMLDQAIGFLSAGRLRWANTAQPPPALRVASCGLTRIAPQKLLM